MTTRRILIKEYEFGTRTPTRNYKRRRVEQRAISSIARKPFVFISSNTVGKISQASKTFRFRIILREIKRHIPFRDGIFDSTKSLCGSYLRCDEWRPPQWSNGTLSFLRRAVCSVAESKIREGKHKADNKLVRVMSVPLESFPTQHCSSFFLCSCLATVFPFESLQTGNLALLWLSCLHFSCLPWRQSTN